MITRCGWEKMIMITRQGCSWKRVEAFPGLGIAFSLITVLIYQVSPLLRMISNQNLVNIWSPLCFKCGNVLAKKMTANTFVMVLWREVCLVPQVTFWKGNAPHEGFLSVSALYLYLYLQYVPPIIHSGQNPFPRNKLPLLAIRLNDETISFSRESSPISSSQSCRALGDALNMMCHFYALNVLPLGDVMMIAAVRVTFIINHEMIVNWSIQQNISLLSENYHQSS